MTWEYIVVGMTGFIGIAFVVALILVVIMEWNTPRPDRSNFVTIPDPIAKAIPCEGCGEFHPIWYDRNEPTHFYCNHCDTLRYKMVYTTEDEHHAKETPPDADNDFFTNPGPFSWFGSTPEYKPDSAADGRGNIRQPE